MLRASGLTVAGRLNEVSVTLASGQVTAIVGPNGAGKSTLLSALAGLIPGNVTLNDRPLSAMPALERAQAIGFLPQGSDVVWNLSVETLVRLGRLPHRTSRPVDDAAVAQALADMAIAPLAGRAVGTLSGGERARVLLARVLAGAPRWILADEPLASLDLAHACALLAHFRRLADAGTGVALVLHDLAQAMNHADQVIVLDHGRIVTAGVPDEALDQTTIARVWGVDAHWLGAPGARALVW